MQALNKKNLFFILLILIPLTSFCQERKEKFMAMDTTEINAKLASTKGLEYPEDVMRLYYPYRLENSSEGNEFESISMRILANNKTEVTLIHDNLMDDSVRGIKIIMVVEKTPDRWKVKSIKRSQKCWKGRGHTDWGIKNCM